MHAISYLSTSHCTGVIRFICGFSFFFIEYNSIDLLVHVFSFLFRCFMETLKLNPNCCYVVEKVMLK